MPTNMRTLYPLLFGFAFVAVPLYGQTSKPAAPTATPAVAAKEIVLTATTANVKESGTPVSIRLFRWSTDQERAALVAAFNTPAAGRQGGGSGRAATTPAAAGQGQAARGQGQGRAAQAQDQDDQQDGHAPRPQGRGQGRGGRGAAPAAPATSPFMQAIQKAPTLGYLFTNE